MVGSSFDACNLPTLSKAAEELAWLTDRGYPPAEAVQFVTGFRGLDGPQTRAILAGLCSDEQYKRNAVRELDPEDIAKRPLRLDTSNVLTTVESVLAGQPVLGCVDGTYRPLDWDRSGYRIGPQTDRAIELCLRAARSLRPSVIRWFVAEAEPDREALVKKVTEKGKPASEAKIVVDPAENLRKAVNVASADPEIIGVGGGWINLAAIVLSELDPQVVRLQG